MLQLDDQIKLNGKNKTKHFYLFGREAKIKTKCLDVSTPAESQVSGIFGLRDVGYILKRLLFP